MAKKWWEGLLRVMAACSASSVALGNPPRNLFLENPGVGTLFSVLEAISVSTEASLATHVKMKLCVAHCQQSHGYLGPELTKPMGETECPSDMVGVLLLPLPSQLTLTRDYQSCSSLSNRDR